MEGDGNEDQTTDQSLIASLCFRDVKFGSVSQNVLKLILKSPRFVPFGANLTQFGCQI